MAIDINASDKQVVNVNTLYTGLNLMKVISINPSLEELKAIGIPAQKEPEYTTKEKLLAEDKVTVLEEWDKTRLDIYIQSVSPKILTKLSFWIEAKNRTDAKNTKFQWINVTGASTWATFDTKPYENDSTKSWFKEEGARIAKPGEEFLHEWLRAWANVETGQRCQLNDMNKIASGDVSELKGYVSQLANQEVKYLLGVKDNQYQSVYDKMFGRAYEKSNARWIKKLADPYGVFKADYQNDLLLKEFTGTVLKPDNIPADQGGAPQTGGKPLVF